MNERSFPLPPSHNSMELKKCRPSACRKIPVWRIHDVSVFVVKKEKQRRGKSTNWRGAKVDTCHSFNLLEQGKSLNFLESSILTCWGRWEGQTPLSSVPGHLRSLAFLCQGRMSDVNRSCSELRDREPTGTVRWRGGARGAADVS